MFFFFCFYSEDTEDPREDINPNDKEIGNNSVDSDCQTPVASSSTKKRKVSNKEVNADHDVDSDCQTPVASSSTKKRKISNKNVNADHDEVLGIVRAMNDRDEKQYQEQNKMDKEYLEVFKGIGAMFDKFLSNKDQNKENI